MSTSSIAKTATPIAVTPANLSPKATPPSPAARSAPLPDLIARELPSLIALRRDLHAHPELSFKETRTASVVAAELSRLGIAHKTGLAGSTGILAHLPATAPSASASCVALRADMDALPILERTGLPYASTNPGVMHACGHDGHTTILLGAARVLAAIPRPRPVTLIFQPAEEDGGGGEKLCQQGALDGSLFGPPVSEIFGIHAWPTTPLGSVATAPGPFMASTDNFFVTVKGLGSHAAYPHFSRDPIVAASHVVVALQSLVSRAVNPLESAVVTVGSIHAGTATNIIPPEAVFTGTVRTLCPAVREILKTRFFEIIRATASAHGCEAVIDWQDEYPAVVNHPELTGRALDVARRTFGSARVRVSEEPSMGGEDFSYYARLVPGCFFRLGIKPDSMPEYPMLHRPDFDFNDDALATGIELFAALATA